MRIGLVGYGFGGRYFHAPLITAAGCELAGVVTRSAARRAELAKDHPGATAYDSLSDLAGAGVDAVVVSTPLRTHIPLVTEAIGLRLPVVCDKPFAADAAAARKTVEAAEHAGVLLSVYQNRRWDADFRSVRKVLASGELGDVRTFESHMEQYPRDEGVPDSGGGVLLDLGSHLVDQAMQLFGPAESAYAEMHVVEDGRGLDDECFVAVRHAGGARAHLWGTMALQGAEAPRFRVVGDSATYSVQSDDGQTARLISGRNPESDGEEWGRVPEARWGRLYRAGVGEPVPSEPGRWSAFYTGLVNALQGAGPVPVDPWDAVSALEVLDAARESAMQGKVVRLRD